MNLEKATPDICWLAPEMPTAIYNSGATVLDVIPSCVSSSQYPSSQAPLVEPTAPDIMPANSSNLPQFSTLPIPLPPPITILASSNLTPSTSTATESTIIDLAIDGSNPASTLITSPEREGSGSSAS